MKRYVLRFIVILALVALLAVPAQAASGGSCNPKENSLCAAISSTGKVVKQDEKGTTGFLKKAEQGVAKDLKCATNTSAKLC